jgi:hypothetical protein
VAYGFTSLHLIARAKLGASMAGMYEPAAKFSDSKPGDI